MQAKTTFSSSSVLIQIKMVLLLLCIFSSWTITATETVKPFVVVLDAGHGGHDPGNVQNGYFEKNIALAIVLKLGAELEKNKDIKVIYTRKSDKFVNLFVRGEIANKAKADLFISVHCDSFSGNAYGAHTFVLGLHRNQTNFNVAKKENSVIYLEEGYRDNYASYDINSPESTIGLTIMQEEFLDQSVHLARLIQQNVKNKLKRRDRGVKQAGFIVLHQTFMPSVLVETGYLSNKSEGAYLNSKKGQSEFGKALADAVLNYKSQLSSNLSSIEASNFVAAPEPTATNTNPSAISSDIYFRIQIAASPKVIDLKSYNFKGLRLLYKLKDGRVYRYFYGKTAHYSTAKELLQKAKNKGYSSAFISAFKGDALYPLSKALESLDQQ
jgi:N-acetylmuramoyl-L-alanine amidase